jgi:4-hydroxybenzoate polyprenyltransferase
MKLITAFFRLIRWQNLVFIGLTQGLFYYSVYHSLFKAEHNASQFFWIMAASILIAAAGYIINDYFDLNIDLINKPSKNVINLVISRRWAIAWHLILSIAAVACTIMAVSLQKWYLILANVACILLLWFYSTSFKRQLLIGNIVIAVLTAWTVLVIFYTFVPLYNAIGTHDLTTVKYFRAAFLYAGFAFIITLIREAVKDMEDMKGDARYGCKTLPIVAGITATKIYTMVWTIVLIGALIILQLYVLQFNWWWAVIYSSLLVIAPLVYFAMLLFRANATPDFKKLSAYTKWIMLAGILSMIFFRIYL